MVKSRTGRAHGLSGSRLLFRPGLRSSRSQGCEWQRGSCGGRQRLRDDGVLQAEDGETGTRTPAAVAEQLGGRGRVWLGAAGGGGKKVEAAESLISTGEREKRL